MKKILLILVMAFFLSFAFNGSALAFSSQARDFPSPEQLKYTPLKFQLPQAERKTLSNGISLHIS